MNGDAFKKFTDKMARQIEADIFASLSTSTTSTAASEPTEFTAKTMEEMIKALTPVPPPLEFYSSIYATERDGDRPEKRRRSWKERLFSRPWTPWVAEKTIMVPNYKPAIYRVGDRIIYHPALEDRVRAIVANDMDKHPESWKDKDQPIDIQPDPFQFRLWHRNPFFRNDWWAGGA